MIYTDDEYIDYTGAPLAKAHDDDAAWDLSSSVEITVEPGATALVSTGVRLNLPFGWCGKVMSRSGNALKGGFIVANAPGIVDSGYTGDIGVIIYNITDKPLTITPGQRVAQLMIERVPGIVLNHIEENEFEKAAADKERGAAGFGSTGD